MTHTRLERYHTGAGQDKLNNSLSKSSPRTAPTRLLLLRTLDNRRPRKNKIFNTHRPDPLLRPPATATARLQSREVLDELRRHRAEVGEHLGGAVDHVRLLEGHALVAAELDNALVHGR